MGSRRVAAPGARSTRDMILDVAERRFAERGFDGVAVRDIASEAGLKNQASLYNHFRNKLALYEAVLARGIVPIIALVAEGEQVSADGRNPATGAKTRDVLSRLIQYLAVHPHVPRLIQRAALDEDRYIGNVAIQLLRPLYNQGLDVLARSGGPWEPSDLPHLAAGIYHLIFGYFTNAALLEAVFQTDPRHSAAVARQLRFLERAVAILLGGVSRAPARTRGTRSRALPCPRDIRAGNGIHKGARTKTTTE